MHRGRRGGVLLTIAAVSLIMAGCSADDTSAGTTTQPTTSAVQSTTTAATTTTEAASTTTPSTTATTEAPPTTAARQDLEAFCDGYLAFLGAHDPESRVEPLNVVWAERGPEAPAELEAAIETLKTADYGSENVRPQHVLLHDYVMPVCEEKFQEGIVAAADDATAAEQFFAALVAGDKEAARTLAAAHVVAPFDPWEPYPDQGGAPELVLDDGLFYVTLTPEYSFWCEMSRGIVTGCFFG